MTTVRASARLRTGSEARGRSRLRDIVLPPATALSVLALALLVLLLPPYMHTALDAVGAPATLGMSPADAHRLSDLTVGELLVGPGTFSFAGPSGAAFYDPAEQDHLRDVRLVLYAFLALGAASAVTVATAVATGRREPATWRAVARGGAGLAVGLAFVGVFAALAFDVAFELFHRLLFPGGNWAFDPGTQRLVQLYPLPFWQIAAAAMGVLGIGGGLATWALARRQAQRLGAAGRASHAARANDDAAAGANDR